MRAVARLKGLQLDPTMQLVLNRGLPDDDDTEQADHVDDIDTSELSEAVCVAHRERLYAIFDDLKCHHEFVNSSEFSDEYSRAVMRDADRHTKFCIVGIEVCEARRRKLRAMHDGDSG